MRHRLIIFSLAAIAASSAWADEYRSKINEGYDLYKSGEYEKAVEQFKEAGILKPDHALPSYDKGTALYKSNDFEGAAGEFESSITKDDPKLKSDALFNAGNAYFKAQKYDQAVKSYVDALKINSKDKDYKQNLELALQQMQQQQQQQQQQDQNKDQQKQDEQKQDQQKQNEQKQDEQKQDEQKQDQEQQQNQENEQDKKKDQKKGSPQEQEMSQEKAEELLARFADDEKEIQKRLKQVNVRGQSANDW